MMSITIGGEKKMEMHGTVCTKNCDGGLVTLHLNKNGRAVGKHQVDGWWKEGSYAITNWSEDVKNPLPNKLEFGSRTVILELQPNDTVSIEAFFHGAFVEHLTFCVSLTVPLREKNKKSN